MAEMNIAIGGARPAVEMPVIQGKPNLEILLRPEVSFEPAKPKSNLPNQLDELKRREEDAQEATKEKVEASRQVILRGYTVPSRLQLEIFEETGDVFAKIVDVDSGDVLRTLPPVAILELRARIDRYVGVLLDEYA